MVPTSTPQCFELCRQHAEALDGVDAEQGVVLPAQGTELGQVCAPAVTELHPADREHAGGLLGERVGVQIERELPTRAHRLDQVDLDPLIAQGDPGIDVRRELVVRDDHAVAWLPVEARGDHADAGRGVPGECDVGYRNAREASGRGPYSGHHVVVRFVSQAALVAKGDGGVVHGIDRHLGDRRDAGVVQVDVALGHRELVAGERRRGHSAILTQADARLARMASARATPKRLAPDDHTGHPVLPPVSNGQKCVPSPDRTVIVPSGLQPWLADSFGRHGQAGGERAVRAE